MERLKIFTKHLFSLRNLVPLLIIAGALIGSLGISPFGIKFSNEQIVLALLAFLAIDSLIERLDILGKIESDVSNLKEVIHGKVKSTSFIKRRSDFPRIEHLIKTAKKEIWIAGITLENTVAISGDLEEKVSEGCKVWILALHPFGKTFPAAADYFDVNPATAPDRIYGHLINIHSKLSRAKKGSFEIRVYDGVFPTGYLVVDPDMADGWMNIQTYLYYIRPHNAPFFQLKKNEDSEWFATYRQQFLFAWKKAEKFDPAVIKPSAEQAPL